MIEQHNQEPPDVRSDRSVTFVSMASGLSGALVGFVVAGEISAAAIACFFLAIGAVCGWLARGLR